MKNNGKNQSPSDSCSVSEAATLLGVSIPTLKRMADDGTLDGFRTPGGHLRITAESIEATKTQPQARARAVREASPVLQNRRERLEELTIQAQEHRARRELEKLQREDQEEAERREAEAQAREEEAAQRRAELELERGRLEYQKAQERIRQQREGAKERQRQETEWQLAAFHCRWQEKAAQALSEYQYQWLSAGQRKEVLEGIEAEIEKRAPADESRMAAIIARTLEALVEPLKAEREAQERRQRLADEALRSLPYSATEAEKVKATAAIREALRRFDNFADVCEIRVAAQEAVQALRQAIERRQLEARLINWALRQLPWGKTERDEARLRRECAEILAELPVDTSEIEGKEALEPTVKEACAEITTRQVENARQARKAQLVAEGVAQVNSYMLELLREDEITNEECFDRDLTTRLENAVRRGLESELNGEETTKEILRLTRQIIDGELG